MTVVLVNQVYFEFGFDNDDRGGLFIERKFTLLNTPKVLWTFTPQYFVQKSLFPDILDSDDEDENEDVDTFESFCFWT